jgi:hypothetical protein
MNLTDYPTPYSDASMMSFPDGDHRAEVVDIEISRDLERRLAARGAALELVLRRGAGMQRSDQYLNEVLSACRQTLTETAPK